MKLRDRDFLTSLTFLGTVFVYRLESFRFYLCGQCLDINLFSWIFQKTNWLI